MSDLGTVVTIPLHEVEGVAVPPVVGGAPNQITLDAQEVLNRCHFDDYKV